MRHLISVLFAPRATFEKVRGEVDWVSPLLVLSLVVTLYKMIISRSEFTLAMMVDNYGVSVLGICASVTLYALLLSITKSMLKATEGTYWQLCKVVLFSLAPGLLYNLVQILLLLLFGVEAVDQGGMFIDISLQVVDVVVGVAMMVWMMVLIMIGASVNIAKPAWSIFWRFISIWIALLGTLLLFIYFSL